MLDVAPDLLGRTLVRMTDDGPIELRLTEVEAYAGEADPGSHAYRGRTARNAVMFGPPGHVYVYFTYGMWHCSNLVCGAEGTAAGVLLRAGEIRVGHDLARHRRTSAKYDRELAKGPARLATALDVDRSLDGADACAGPASPCPSWPAPPPRPPPCAADPAPGWVVRAPCTLALLDRRRPDGQPVPGPHAPQEEGLTPDGGPPKLDRAARAGGRCISTPERPTPPSSNLPLKRGRFRCAGNSTPGVDQGLD